MPVAISKSESGRLSAKTGDAGTLGQDGRTFESAARTASPVPAANGLETLLKSVGSLGIGASSQTQTLETLHVGIGNAVRVVQIHEVLYFETADKYVNVVTADGEGLVRISMRDLLGQIDSSMFMQVHRAVVVNRKAITFAQRDDARRVTLQLRGTAKTVPVSRAFAHLFRPM